MRYIHDLKAWPKFAWDDGRIAKLLGAVRNRQGRLVGRMEAMGFPLRETAAFETMTIEVVKSSEIEGERLDPKQVRSSIARKLGMNIEGLIPSERHVDGVVEMMLDASRNFNKPLTRKRLLGWQASLFPGGYSGMHKIKVGAWRDDSHGPMQVVSGPVGRESLHFEAPEAARLDKEMSLFLEWFNAQADIDPLLKAGVAHLWFVTIHPFEDGNGRIARAITDMQLARSDGSSQRFYSMSAQIRKERSAYYEIIEHSQKAGGARENDIDITLWLEWFLSCLDRALLSTESILADVFRKARFWETHGESSLNARQKRMINMLLDGFEGKLTSTKWAKITKCSQDTAHRDIINLIEKGILERSGEGGRSTSYSLARQIT